ncbi:COesterase and/or Abhydrolase 3 domain containing protein, partial [Asbolus verrucosus]
KMSWKSIHCYTFYLMNIFFVTSSTIDPIVQTSLGRVQGINAFSRNGRIFYSFRGIPYAMPPIGNLRFKSPHPLKSWNGMYNAQNDAPACLQKNYLFGKSSVEGSEDCLYINIYTPKLGIKTTQYGGQLLPVMVFIHWGGFFTGYSNSNYLGPEYFMDEDVVLVSFNYRLGVLGFLSTYDDASPGNYGLKDQLAALKWVQENIENFGGNRHKVTLFGQSAGGASVHFHMFNPLSKDLFHQGISESGTALALWAKPLGKEQLQIARLQATLVGCKDSLNDTFSLVDCLRHVDAEDLVNSGDNFKYFSIDPLTVYLPSIEKKTKDNPHPFLIKEPMEYILNGDFHHIPWILGTVEDEGIIRAAGLLSQPETRINLNKNFNDLMPNLTALFMSTPKEKIQIVWEKIKNYYFGGENSIDLNNNKTIQGLINLYTDRAFAYSLFQTALLHSHKGHTPLWLYNFKYRGQYSYGELFAASQENINYKWGVCHCDELIYLFKSPAIFPELRDPNDIIISKILISLWTNFATY